MRPAADPASDSEKSRIRDWRDIRPVRYFMARQSSLIPPPKT